MRIATIADLHLNDNNAMSIIEGLWNYSANNDIDLLLIAGDISEDVHRTIEYVNIISAKVPVRYVPGNHDLWNKYNNMETKDIFQMYLADPNCLLMTTGLTKAGVEIIGHIGWYDYSLGDTSKYSIDELDSMTINERTWNDKHYVDFGINNKQMCDLFNAQLEGLIRSTGGKKILLTHMISHPGFKVENDPFRKNEGFFNSFIGSEGLYKISQDDNIEYVICGHVHYRKTIQEGNRLYICPCLGTEKEWSRYLADTSIEAQLEHAIQVITL